MINKLLTNVKHVPSTAMGGLAGIVAFILANSDVIQGALSVNPKWAQYGVGIVGVATSLGLILGVGPNDNRGVKP